MDQYRRGEAAESPRLDRTGGGDRLCDAVVYQLFFDNGSDVARSLEEIKAEFESFTNQSAYFIFVTNEIGMGGVSVDDTQRRFTDLQGWANQFIASRADEVVLMVSGIPVPVK